MKKELIIISAAIIVFIAMVIFFCKWQCSKTDLDQANKLNNIMYSSAKEVILDQKKHHANKIKKSDQRYDSIYKLHTTFVAREKKHAIILNKNLNEIKTLNVNTRAAYVDSLLRFKHIR